MTINAVLDTLLTLPDCRVYLELPTSAQTPCMFVRDVAVTYGATFGEAELAVALVVLVSYADIASAPRHLNDLLDFEAVPSSLVELGFSPVDASGKALYSFGGATLLGSELTCTIELD